MLDFDFMVSPFFGCSFSPAFSKSYTRNAKPEI
jgi:hypothetical protein